MIKSKSELEKTVRAMLPSRDLRRYLRERKIALGEKDMLKLIDDYACDFSQKLELFDIAAEVFAEKPNKRHAAALAAHYRMRAER